MTYYGQVVVLGGNRDGGISAIVDTIDPASGAARRLALLAAPVHDAAGGLIGNRPAVFGGGAGSARDEMQVVQPGGTTAVAGRLPQPRADVASASSGGTVYLVGGYDGATMTPDVLATDDGVHTRVVARLLVAVRYPSVAITGGQLFVIGGATSGGENAGVDTNVVQQVDLRTGKISIRSRMPATRSHATAIVLGGRVYVLGGHVDGKWSDEVAAFDPATGALRVVAHLPRAVSDAAATVVGSTAYLLGGETAPNTPIADVVELRAG
ncbi:MAG: hypothetical protein QOI55_2216 [Actinomycetota bacterium]|nr:hypothetical protein [Actinomycetota bacterium]